MAIGYLNIKSGYTFLKSSLKIKDIVKYGKDNNLSFLTLTDFNNMFGCMQFIKECKDNNINGIIGMEISLDIYEQKLVLIATSNQGYLSLCKLTSFVSTSTFDKFATLENLEECKDGIVCILPCIRSKFNELEYDKRNIIINHLKHIYTSLYIGLEVYDDKDILKLDEIRDYASKNNLLCLPCQEILTLDYSTAYLLDVLDSIDQNIPMDKIDKKNHTYKYFLSESKIKSIFSEEEINNSNKLASLVEYDFTKIKGDLVEYPIKNNYDKFEYLRALSIKGLEKRFANKVLSKYYERLEYELSIIKQMNYVNYFLVVFDYVKFAKQNDILVGPGRGSASSSLVCYALGISNVDPIKYNLLFERFLNPQRISMPDIDVDFIDTKRDLVIDYLANKYGKDKIGRVISFQTFKAKSALNDVSKAYGFSLSESRELSKKIGDKDDYSLEEVIKNNPSFLSTIKTNDKYMQVYKTSLYIEGLPRQTSMHAAGVVANNTPLYTILPVYDNDFNLTLTQYDGNYIEQFNLYKMDLLGIANLSIIDNCVKMIKEDKNIDIDLKNIDLDDPNIYKILNKGLYGGIFQMDENSIRNASRQIKPSCFMDIVVTLALGRPGPMQFIPTYVDRKNNKIPTIYPHKSLEPILKETYGIIVYQEQVMQILVKMAGFSLGKADLTRRAISKKNAIKLQAEKTDFINGCIKNGYSNQDAISVFESIEKFADYGFVKAHSVAYSMISAQMLYLKACYPSYFFTSLLNNGSKDNKLEQYFYETKLMGIKLLNPSINKSDFDFKQENNNIRFGLSRIKGITSLVASIIIKNRVVSPYKDFVDFVRRTLVFGLKEENYKTLIYAGCFDEFNINRNTLINNLNTIMMYGSIVSKIIDDKLVINNLVSEPIINEYNDDILENTLKEKEVLGLNLSINPLEKYRNKFNDVGIKPIIDINEDGIRILTIGKITRVSTIITKKKETMAFLDIEDETGIIGVTVFPSIYQIYKDILKIDNYVQIKGSVEQRNEGLSIIADKFKIYELKVE